MLGFIFAIINSYYTIKCFVRIAYLGVYRLFITPNCKHFNPILIITNTQQNFNISVKISRFYQTWQNIGNYKQNIGNYKQNIGNYKQKVLKSLSQYCNIEIHRYQLLQIVNPIIGTVPLHRAERLSRYYSLS